VIQSAGLNLKPPSGGFFVANDSRSGDPNDVIQIKAAGRPPLKMAHGIGS
jgi:hypothetical protein